MIHIDTNQSTSLQTTCVINISCIYTQSIDLCISYLSEFRDFYIDILPWWKLWQRWKEVMTSLSKVHNFWCPFNSKMIHFRADSNYLANMNMAWDWVCSTEPETACWEPQLPRPAARGSSCRWGPATAAWAGAKGYRKTASGRSACRHGDRTWKPGSWCKGLSAERLRGTSMWWRPARGPRLIGQWGLRCGGGPRVYKGWDGWRTSFGTRRANSPLLDSSLVH